MRSWGKRKAVLSVNVPGMAPYAVLVSGFKPPAGKGDYAGAGLPALVSNSDPTDVEILWDEVPSLEGQIAQRFDDSMKDQRDRLAQAHQMQEQMIEAARGADSKPGSAPASPVGPAAEMMAENAKRTLAYVKDPAMREMLIKQYRAAGIRIEEGEEAS